VQKELGDIDDLYKKEVEDADEGDIDDGDFRVDVHPVESEAQSINDVDASDVQLVDSAIGKAAASDQSKEREGFNSGGIKIESSESSANLTEQASLQITDTKSEASDDDKLDYDE